jgi:transposase InsO family protein
MQYEPQGQLLGQRPGGEFFSLLKRALVFHNHYQTRAQARQSIFDYIERFYNRKRIHSSLGYRTPFEVDQLRLAA